MAPQFASRPVKASLSESDRSAHLDHWIGQMLMVGFRGTELAPDAPFVEDLKQLHLGGVILFDYDAASRSAIRNIVSAEQLKRLTARLQSAATAPLFIAIDQEGGRVVRLKEKHGFASTPSHFELGQTDGEERTRSVARQIATTLSSLGINVNFAPVLDLAINPDNPVIAQVERSFGADPDLVRRHASWMIEEFHRAGILCAIKHFPGHGSSREDSHFGLPDVSEIWSRIELQPFAALIRTGLPDLVMTAHLYNRNWDERYPATLSPQVISELLRNELGFQGVVVSDDLQMKAIAKNYSFEKTIEQAVKAGVDVLLFANNSSPYEPDLAQKAFHALRNLVHTGAISQERIRESYRRIKNLKDKLVEE